MHEILTIQLGHRANHIATHFWNAQESYFTYDLLSPPSPINHDIHFRPGVNTKGEETFTPRTLIYDLKGGFGGLRKWGGLYDQELSLEDGEQQQGQNGVWAGKVALHQDPKIPQSDYQYSLDQDDPYPRSLNTESVRYWSDYNRVYYHPRSIIQLNDYELNSSLLPFENYETGEELFANSERHEDLLDRDLRPWAEECDQMQGIQILSGQDDAWAGFAARYTERLRDEYGKANIWVWGVGEEQGKGQQSKQALRAVNYARLVIEMSAHSSMYVPMSIPCATLPDYMQLDKDSHWHTSALLSVALESMTIPSRMQPNGQRPGHLADLASVLNINGNQHIAQLQCKVLDPMTMIRIPKTREEKDGRVRSSLIRTLMEEDESRDNGVDLDIDLSPSEYLSIGLRQKIRSNHMFGGLESLRGELDSGDSEIDEDEAAYAKKRRRFAGMPVVERYHTAFPVHVLDSFPSIFNNAADGKVSVRTSLSTSTRTSRRIRELQKVCNMMVNLDEREAMSNSLGQIAEAYEEGFDSGNEGDSDS